MRIEQMDSWFSWPGKVGDSYGNMAYLKVTNLIFESLLCVGLSAKCFTYIVKVNPMLKTIQWKVYYYYHHFINFARSRAEI